MGLRRAQMPASWRASHFTLLEFSGGRKQPTCGNRALAARHAAYLRALGREVVKSLGKNIARLVTVGGRWRLQLAQHQAMRDQQKFVRRPFRIDLGIDLARRNSVAQQFAPELALPLISRVLMLTHFFVACTVGGVVDPVPPEAIARRPKH